MKIIWKKQVVRIDGVERLEVISWLSPTQLYNNENINGYESFSHIPINTFTQYRAKFGRNLIARCTETSTGKWKLTLESKRERLIDNELLSSNADQAQIEAESIISNYLQDFIINENL